MRYLLVISKAPNTDYGGLFPDVPGCYATGQSAPEVQWRAYDALRAHLADEEPPPSRDVQALANDPEVDLDDPTVVEMAWVAYEPEPVIA